MMLDKTTWNVMERIAHKLTKVAKVGLLKQQCFGHVARGRWNVEVWYNLYGLR